MRYGGRQTELFIILYCFLLFYHTMDPENQNFEKRKKTAEGIIIIEMCTTNDSHMMYGSWDMESSGQNVLSFFDYFLPFYPVTTQNNKILKKWKKVPGDIIILHKSTIMTIIWCMVPEIWSMTDKIFCHLGPFFALLPP